jgi:hypothetical protein
LRIALLIIFVALSFVSSGAAQTATTFGPKQYTRGKGATQSFSETFSRCAGGTCQLVIVNGNPDGSNRVSSASVALNGVQLLGPSDFDPNVARLVLPVNLADNDQLSVNLNSKPGSFLTVSVECSNFASLGVALQPGVVSSIWNNGTVSVAIPLQNLGNTEATNVSITNIQAGSGAYLGPTPFAYAAGTIDPDESQQINAEFSGLNGNAPFPLTVSGTYNFGPSVCPFQASTSVAPPPGNGGTPKFTTTVQSFNSSTASYPVAPQFHPPSDEPNAENIYSPPLGRPRYLFPTPPALSTLNLILAANPNDQTPPPSGSPNDVVFLRNQKGGITGGLPPDPSLGGSTPGGFVLITSNTSVSYSTDYGKTFKIVNLTKATGFSDPTNPGRPDFFPENDGGLCCDQIAHYIPGRNLMVWLLQYWSPSLNVGGLPQKGQDRLRIAWATPEAAAADFLHAWSWFDISPTTLGDTVATDWMDYPDLSYSNDWLYISVDHGLWNAGTNSSGAVIGQQVYNGRRWFMRSSLNDMVAKAGSVNLVYYEALKNGVVKAHFAQSSPDTMYYAAQPDTSTLSVFADPDSSANVPTPKDLSVTSYCLSAATSGCDFTVNAPDNVNWDLAPHGVLGAAYVSPGFLCPASGCVGPTHFLYFAFDGGRDNTVGRAFPYVRVEKVDADALNLISEMDIWNSGFAFATPGLNWRPNSAKDDVAISLATGGGGSYADNAVGFLNDFVLYQTTSSNATESNNIPQYRYGDYFDVRNAVGPVTDAGQGVGFSTLAYAVTQSVAGNTCNVSTCNVTLQYVLFGRNSDLFPSPTPPIR